MSDEPRIGPGTARDTGVVNFTIARLLGAATGGRPPNIFLTLGRHRALFRRWLAFAGALMPGGVLPRADSELVILRVAHNCGAEYEWRHHERLAVEAGLSTEEVALVREGPAAAGWSPRRAVLLRAADELHARRVLSDELWAGLRPLLSDVELIELCMLVGHYEMLAMTLNSLRVEPDPAPMGMPPRALRVLRALVERGRAS